MSRDETVRNSRILVHEVTSYAVRFERGHGASPFRERLFNELPLEGFPSSRLLGQSTDEN